MSRKSHPIGYKLGVSYLWEINCNLLNYRFNLLQNFFLFHWVLKFCIQNFFYFFAFHYLYETRTLVLYSFLFFFNLLTRKRNFNFRRILFLLKKRFKYRRGKLKKIKRKLYLKRFKYNLYLIFLLMRVNRKFTTKRLRSFFKQKKIAKSCFKIKTKKAILFFFNFRNNSKLLFRKATFRNTKLKKKYLSSLSLRAILKQKKRIKINKYFYKKGTLRRNSYNSHKVNSRNGKHVQSKLKFDKKVSSKLNLIQPQKIKLPKKTFTKNYNLKLLTILQYKIFLLRFKYFLEKKLSHFGTKQCILLLGNIGTLGLSSRLPSQGKTKKIFDSKNFTSFFDRLSNVVYNDIFEYNYFSGLKNYASLFLVATMYLSPRVLIQWFNYKIIRIRKHSLNTSHTKLLALFTSMLQNAILLSALLKGYRFEVIGKINGSLRTKKALFYFGVPVKRQSFASVYDFYNSSVPTYAGTLSLKLWLIK